MATPAAVLSVLVQAKGIAETNRKLKDIDDSSKKTADSTGKLEGRFSKLDSTVGDFNRSAAATGNVVKLIKFPALIAGAGMATQAVGALGAGAVSLAGALGPLAGLGAAGAAGYAAMAQASGTLKLATMGLDKALAGDKKALAALPPEGQKLVAMLKGLKPELKGLQQTAQAGLLPGLAEGVQAALPALRPLKVIVGGTARALGDLAAQAGALVGSKSVLRDLTTIGGTNVGVIRNMGNAALILAHALIGVIAAGGPLLTWLSKVGVKMATWIDQQVTAGRESGKLAAFLERTRAVMTTLGGIIGNLVTGFYNIGKAATPLGTDLLDKFGKLTKKFREWTESATGQNQIATYFRNAKAPLLEIFGLIGDVAGALLRISQGKGATGLVKQLRTLVPVMESVVTSTTAAFGPALIQTLGDVLRLFGLLAGSSGPLVQMVRLIGLIAAGATALLTSVPGLNSMTVSFIGLYGSVKALAFVVAPLSAGFGLLEAALIGSTTATAVATTATIGERIALAATAVAMYAAAAATAVMTAGTWLLNGAIAVLTSPITLAVVAIAALVAGVILAYQHSETFRNIIDGLWGTLKTVTGWLTTAGVAAFNAVANAVKAAWGVVQTVTMTVWGAIKAFLMPLWTLFATVANVEFIAIRTAVQIAWFAIQTVTTTVWGAIKAFLLPLWTAIKTAAGIIFGALRAVIVGEWTALSTAATTIWNLIKAAILTPIRAVRDALSGKDGIWASIHDSATAAWDRIKGALSGFAKGVKDGILDAIKGGLNILIGFVNDVIGVINSIPGVTNIKKIAKLAEGGTVSGGGPNGTGKLARGGLVGLAKGAMVPGSGSGDKVPLYLGGRLAAMVEPGEFVSVANRNATSALMDVNSQVPRFATGGVFSSTSYGPPWTGINGSGVTATGTNLRGSPHIFGVAVDPSVIALGSMLDITPNPFATKEKFKAFDTGSAIKDRRIDFYDWRGRAEQFGWGARDVRVSGIANLGQGGADSIGDILAALNPLDFIKKLPGIGDLPDWLQGTGKWILDQVGDYITSAVSGIFGGGGAGDAPEKFSHMISMANRMDAMDIPYGPQGHAGWALNQSGEDCSSSVSKVLHAAGYLTNVLTTVGLPGALEEGPGKMVTVHDRALAGNAGHTIMQIGNRFFGTSGQNPGGGPGWFSNPGAGYLSTLPTKLHPKGMAQGGVFGQGTPFVGSYRNGGVVPQDGLGYLHQGETVSPRGAGGALVHIEHMEVSRETDVERVARSLAWKLQTG